jgi:hypothetical protein
MPRVTTRFTQIESIALRVIHDFLNKEAGEEYSTGEVVRIITNSKQTERFTAKIVLQGSWIRSITVDFVMEFGLPVAQKVLVYILRKGKRKYLRYSILQPSWGADYYKFERLKTR